MRKIKDIDERSTSGDGVIECVFCDKERVDAAVAVHGSVFAVKDQYPVTEGHLLIIPRRHTSDFFSMTEAEKADASVLIEEVGNE